MSKKKGTVLVVDDEDIIQRACKRVLTDDYDVKLAGTVQEAREALKQGGLDACLIDVKLPDGDGLDLVSEAKRFCNGVEVIVMTGHGGVAEAVTAVKRGAYDFLTKPFDPIDKVNLVVGKAVERKQLRDRAERLEREVGEKYGFDNIVGSAPEMARALELAQDVAYSTSSVLIRGESGTGKELIARAIHHASPRARRPLVVVNCGALPENLIESEMFGHVKGAFTGAGTDKRGLFEEADGGTIFLDEIGEMPVQAQVRLLRVLQDGEVRRVGSNKASEVDVRVIAATNADLTDAMREGRFREDVYYRLNVITVELPPLRKRREDVPLLAHHFIRKYATRMDKNIDGLTDDALQLLAGYHWPGNVRELENAIERAVVLCREDTIGAERLPEYLLGESGDEPTLVSNLGGYREAKERAISEFERGYISALLRSTDGNMAKAARVAGLDRSNFRKIVKRVGLDHRDFRPGKPGNPERGAEKYLN